MNNANYDYLLFVIADSYSELGFGQNVTRVLYAEAMHLLDSQGNQYKSIGGIQGLPINRFNQHALEAVLEFSTTSHFTISFPIPEEETRYLTFISPHLHGHQNSWYWTIFNIESM